MREVPTGGCLCGAVRYRIDAAPVEALYCHCRMCGGLRLPDAGAQLACYAARRKSQSRHLD